MSEEFEMVEKDVDNLLKYFKVNNEQELYEKIMVDSLTIPCFICKREFLVDELEFIDGDPFCHNCLND
jgi:hypothetical protein